MLFREPESGLGIAKHKGVVPYVIFALAMMLVGAIAVWLYGIAGVVNCDPSGYADGYYLAYCRTKSPLSYEHARVWFGTDQAGFRRADVLFTGASTTQIGFKNGNVNRFFLDHHLNFYVMAFTYGESAMFALDVIRKYDLRPRLVVINSDHAFLPPTQLASYVMDDGPVVRLQFAFMTVMQRLQQAVCRTRTSIFHFACSGKSGLFRSPTTGQWRSFQAETEHLPIKALPVEKDIEPLAAMTMRAKEIRDELGRRGACVVMITAPRDFVSYGSAAEISRDAGIELLDVSTDGLRTYDGTHLDQESAERWSDEILRRLEPIIARCTKAR